MQRKSQYSYKKNYTQTIIPSAIILNIVVISAAYGQSVPDSSEPLDLDPLLEAGSTTAAFSNNSDLDGRQNLPQGTINSSALAAQIGSQNSDDGAAPGIRLSNMILRPSIQSGIRYENETSGDTSLSRTYNQTIISGTLQSDWSKHSLSSTASVNIEKNLSGELNENPSANFDADLQLDINSVLTANLRTGYNYSVEDRSDPNAISNATSQAAIHALNAEVALSKNIGQLRGSTTARFERVIHGDAKLPGGVTISGKDRDYNSYGLTARLQYAANPVLMPFIEGDITRRIFDQTIDNNGVKRSNLSYALRLGLAADLGEKLNGELGIGYAKTNFDDQALAEISGLSLDGNLTWSPQRGTDINLALRSELETSTTADTSGSTLYGAELTANHQLSNQLNFNMGVGYNRRIFSSGSTSPNEDIFSGNIGLEWTINRYLSANADASYTKTKRQSENDTDNYTIGIGLTARR